MTLEPGQRVAILGAGCAGVSVAHRLLDRFPGIELHVFDSNTTPRHDRTWCFWRFPDMPEESAITHRWDRVRIRTEQTDRVIDCGSTPYCHVPSDRFITRGLERIEARCSLHAGVAVNELSERVDGVEIAFGPSDEAGADTRTFDFAFDGRPPQRVACRNSLVQHFVGHELEFADDVFDPSVATLMDFTVDQSAGLHFMYVLPFSASRALVESTYMTPSYTGADDYDANIAEYCRVRLGSTPTECVRTEHGVLPMAAGHVPCRSTARVWQIGTRAGVGRASTGYAFDAIQRDSINICNALADGRPRPRPPRTRLLTVLDRLLISLLHARQSLGPSVFASLFERAPSDAIIRFLSDRPKPSDIARVIAAVPASPMLAHLLRSPRSVLP